MRKIIIFITLIMFSQALVAQNLKINNETSKLEVHGTSTLHDWIINAEQLKGNAVITKENNTLADIKSLDFAVEVNSMKSGKGAMDDNTYKALKSKSHPNITYKFEKINNKSTTAEGLLLDTTGRLTIAGVTKTVNMKVTVATKSDMQVKGEITFNMSDYGIDPPTAVFGTIKTGDQVTIKFDVNYK